VALAEPTSELVERLIALQPRLERVLDVRLPRRLRDELASITAHQLQALGHLPKEGLTMRQFASAVGISGAAATALADRMVTQGLAERRPDPGDRRTVWLAPTERALAMNEQYRAWRREMMATVVQRLDIDQMTALVDILGALADIEEPRDPAATALAPPHLAPLPDAEDLAGA